MTEERPPKVSVVCAWYQRADWVRGTIDSLLAQEYSNLEIVVVNDGSPDPRVQEILESYDDPRLKLIRQRNAGFTQAIRRAIEESDGTYIAIQGAGDVSFPKRIAAQVAYLEERRNFAVVGCGCISQVKSMQGDGASRLFPIGTLEPNANDIINRNPFTHGETMIRRSAYNHVSGYRPFFENAQDRDLWLRLSEHYKLGIIEEVLYQRNIFLCDGIAGDFGKTLRQIAFSRVADFCHEERSNGKLDSVARFGAGALLRMPKDWSTFRRIVRAISRDIQTKGANRENLKLVRDLYGPLYFFASILAYHYFLRKHGEFRESSKV